MAATLTKTGFLPDYEPSPLHKARVRAAAVKRSRLTYPRVSIHGKVYANLLDAARGTGLSARSISRYIKSTLPEHKGYKALPPLKAGV